MDPADDTLPVRTDPRELGDEALTRWNEAWADRGYAWQSFGRERHQILDTNRGYGSSVPSAADLERWLTHPDDRVPLLFFNHGDDLSLEQHPAATHNFGRIVRRRMREAGVVWTPVTDRAARAGWWAGGRSAAKRELEEALGPWIERQTEAETLEALTAFGFGPLATLVARRAQVLSPVLVDWLLEGPASSDRAHHLQAVIRRGVLTGNARERFLDWAVGELAKDRSAEARLYIPARIGLEELARVEGGLPERVRAELLRVGSDRRRRTADPAARALLVDPTVPAGDVEAVADAIKRGPSGATRLLDHPNTPTAVAREIANRHSTPDVRRRLARQARWRRDPEIAEILETSRDVYVQAGLALDLEGRALVRALKHLALRERKPKLALDLARARVSEGVTIPLEPEDIAPMLAHSIRSDIRRAGILLSEHVRADTPVETDPSREGPLR